MQQWTDLKCDVPRLTNGADCHSHSVSASSHMVCSARLQAAEFVEWRSKAVAELQGILQRKKELLQLLAPPPVPLVADAPTPAASASAPVQVHASSHKPAKPGRV